MMKILRTIVMSLIILVLLWMVGTYFWLNSNQDEIQARSEQALIEGKEIGSTSTDKECFETYLGIMPDCDAPTCAIQNQVFLRACLAHSKATPWCNQIPIDKSLISLARWAADECMARNIKNAQCASGLQEAVFYCRNRNGTRDE